MQTESDEVSVTVGEISPLQKPGRDPCSARVVKSRRCCQFAQSHRLAPQHWVAYAGAPYAPTALLWSTSGLAFEPDRGESSTSRGDMTPHLADVDLQQPPPRR